MSNDIKGLGASGSINADSRATSRANEQRVSGGFQQAVQNPTSDANRQASNVSGRDVVELSKGAQALKTVNEKLQKQPEVNEKRVADIKAALESGTYKINDVVIADKLLQIDDLFE